MDYVIIYLKYAHSEGITKNPFWIFVQTVRYTSSFKKKRKRINLLRIQEPPLHQLFYLLRTFFSMTVSCKTQTNIKQMSIRISS